MNVLETIERNLNIFRKQINSLAINNPLIAFANLL